MIHLRPFAIDDYPALSTIVSAAAPEFPMSASTLAARDAQIEPPCVHERWMAERDGSVVGAGALDQHAHRYDPHQFELRVHVLPEFHGQGIGRLLFDRLHESLATRNPARITTFTLENRLRARRFFAERGFVETLRDGQASLDLAHFDFEAWTDAARLPEALSLRTYAALSRSDPDFVGKLCALHNALHADVPSPNPHTPVSAATFARTALSAELILDGCMVAVAPDGEYAGVSELTVASDGDPNIVRIGLTGVHRIWRRQGIALALKLAAMRVATVHGARTMRTGNAAGNVAILTLNERLGFVREPWRIHLVWNRDA